MNKRCFKCGEEKPLDDFYRHSQMRDGHLNKCKECTRIDVTRNRESSLEYYRAYDRARYREFGSRGEPKPETTRRVKEEWRLRNMDKRRTHNQVAHAVRAKRLQKPSQCQRCGAASRLYAHHHDYTKPLDVAWVCSACHADEHRKYPENEQFESRSRWSRLTKKGAA